MTTDPTQPDTVSFGQPEQYPCQELTATVIGCAMTVHRELGPGFVESVYENALSHELAKQQLPFTRQGVVPVRYDGKVVGEHRYDLLVDDQVLVELKSVDRLGPVHTAQVLSTLKAVGVKVGLLLNFNDAVLKNGVKRVVL